VRALADETPVAAQTNVVPKIKTRKPKQRACDERNEKAGFARGI